MRPHLVRASNVDGTLLEPMKNARLKSDPIINHFNDNIIDLIPRLKSGSCRPTTSLQGFKLFCELEQTPSWEVDRPHTHPGHSFRSHNHSAVYGVIFPLMSMIENKLKFITRGCTQRDRRQFNRATLVPEHHLHRVSSAHRHYHDLPRLLGHLYITPDLDIAFNSVFTVHIFDQIFFQTHTEGEAMADSYLLLEAVARLVPELGPARNPWRSLLAKRELVQYHYACGHVARQAIVNFSWIGHRYESYPWFSQSCSCLASNMRYEGYPLPIWIVEYFRGMATVFTETPAATEVDERPLMAKAIEAAQKCEACQPEASTLLPKLTSNKWWPHVNSEIAKVCSINPPHL
ncbi:hypothetical protein C8R43DRAFT_954608 [Mycena crocata]|nr:hypothetical protein C8R43DRAFT_954608 [Mycena crocata]